MSGLSLLLVPFVWRSDTNLRKPREMSHFIKTLFMKGSSGTVTDELTQKGKKFDKPPGGRTLSYKRLINVYDTRATSNRLSPVVTHAKCL